MSKLNVLAMLVGVGGSTVAAIAIGSRDGKAANRAFTLSIVCGIVLGLAFAALRGRRRQRGRDDRT